MKKTLLRLVPIFLSILLCFETGCVGNPQNAENAGKQQEFTEYTNQIFCSEVAASTLNMHYNLAHPEKYGIENYPITYGSISVNENGETSVLLENWKEKLRGFEKSKLTLSQQMTYDIMIDFISKELSATGFDLYDEILRPSTGFTSQLPVLLAEYTFYDERDIKDYLGLLSITPDFFAQIIEFEKKKSQQGLFMADFAADDIVQQCNNFTEEPENNYLLYTFDSRIAEMSDVLTQEQMDAYIMQNRQLVLEKLIPAYRVLAGGGGGV